MHIFFLVPLCQDDLEQMVHLVGGCSLRDGLLGINLEGQARRKEEGGCILAVFWAI